MLVSWNSYGEVLIPSISECDSLEVGILKWQLYKMKSFQWALIRYDCCPYKKGKFGHSKVQKEDQVKAQGDDCHLQAKERDFRRHQHCQPLDLELLDSKMEKINFWCVSRSVCGILLWQHQQNNTKHNKYIFTHVPTYLCVDICTYLLQLSSKFNFKS